MQEHSKFVGLDVHKETVAVSVAEAKGGEIRYVGEIPNTPEAVAKLVRRLRKEGGTLSFCYEAGPCGYGLHRQLRELGQDCMVVAPSLIPKKPGDRVKTDRRDSLMLARLHRAGELTAVWVPDGAQEALRDLTRAREDMKHLQRQAKQRLLAFLLRHGKRYEGGSNWTKVHFRWLEGVKFDHPVQQIVFQEYIDGKARLRPRDLRGRVWVTRKGIRVDRIACAWLIRRYIDPDARIRYVDPATYKPRRGELRFDLFEGEFTHEGDGCSFETFLDRLDLPVPGLRALSELIHDVDLKDHKFQRPETPGFALAIQGVALRHAKDEARMEAGSVLLDAFLEGLKGEPA